MNQFLYFDLLKAKRDLSKLVKVVRMVTVRGKTFPREYYVTPTQVKKTDRVIGNFQNVIPAKGSVPKPAKGVYDQKYFESISQDKNDRSEAIAYLKECGITWREVPSSAGINWMRALEARNKKFGNKTSKPVSSPVSSTNQQSQSNTPAKTITSSANAPANSPDPVKAIGMLNAKALAEFTACANGREKVTVLKKYLGQDGCLQFAKLSGVTWSEHSYRPINLMRMSVALQNSLDAAAGTTSGKAGAPKGNQNAKKDGVKQEDKKKEDTPSKEDLQKASAIEVTEDMTPRQKNMVELINKTTSVRDLKLFSKTGIVAEDDTAKEFIRRQLHKAYFASGNDRKGYYSRTEISKASADALSPVFKGIPKKTLRKGIEIMTSSSSFNLPALLYPREVIEPLSGSYASSYSSVMPSQTSSSYSGNSMSSILSYLSLSFSQHTEEGTASYGYEGYDEEKLKKYFDVNKDGVVVAINHISESDPELKSEADKMIGEYSALLTSCKGSVPLLQKLPHSSYSDLQNKYSSFENQNNILNETVQKLRQIKIQYKLTDEEMDETIKRSYNDSEGCLYKVDKNNPSEFIRLKDNNGMRVTLKKLLDTPSTYSPKTIFDEVDLYYTRENSVLLRVMLKTGKSVENLTEDDGKGIDNNALGVYNGYLYTAGEAKVLSSLSEKEFCDVKKKVLQFSGQKLQKYDENTKTYSDVDMDSFTASDWDEYMRLLGQYQSKPKYMVVPNDKNENRDAILANLAYIKDNDTMNSRIAGYIKNDVPNSKINEQGERLDKNFDYMNSDRINTKASQVPWYSGNLSRAEAIDKVKKQLDNAPVLTKEQLSNMKNFAGDKNSDVATKINAVSAMSLTTRGSLLDHNDSPVYDMIYQQLESISRYCPQIKNTRVKTQEQVGKILADKMDYVPYSVNQDDIDIFNPQEIKTLRETVLAKSHCSLKTSDATEKQTLESRVKHDWDKEKRDSSGKRLYGYISFKSNGVYKINNSVADEVFRENVKKLGETPVSLFHGTDFRGACGIIGVDGHFRAPKDGAEARKNGMKYAGGMLGPGVYLADLAGKSAGYFGNWGAGYGKRGALLVCDAVMGTHATAPDSYSVRNRMDVDSVSMRAGTNAGTRTLRADEWCVRRCDYVSPQYIIDSEANRRD